jgi:two-component system LytT family response regulator
MRTDSLLLTPPRIRALLVDDESPARRRLTDLLKAHPEVEVIAEASGVDEAVVEMKGKHPDVIFLDIQMKPKTGFDLLKVLPPPPNQIEVVFVTAFDTYALKAFDAHALDYLTKPVRAGRLQETIQRLKRILSAKPGEAEVTTSPEDLSLLVVDDLVILKDSRQRLIVRVGDICSIQAEGHHTRIMLPQGESFLKHRPFSYWKSRLPAPPFVRLSRSLLVNMSVVARISAQGRNRSQLCFKTTATTVTLSRLEAERIRRVS